MRIRVAAGTDPLAVGTAALAHAHEAFVRIAELRGGLEVELEPKARLSAAGLRALARSFGEELAAQALRWTLARHNRGLRAEMAANAAAAAPEWPSGSVSAVELTPEEASRIAALAAESGGTAPDPLGIRVHWSELGRGKKA